MSNSIYKNLIIIIEYGENFKKQITNGEIDALTGIKIEINGTDLTGAHDDIFYVDDYIYTNLMKLLNSISNLHANKKSVIRYQGVPFDLILQPSGKDLVSVAFCDFDGKSYNPNIPDKGIPVLIDVLTLEFIRVSKEFLNKVLDLNPKFKDTNEVIEFQKAIETAEKAYSDNFKKRSSSLSLI